MSDLDLSHLPDDVASHLLSKIPNTSTTASRGGGDSSASTGRRLQVTWASQVKPESVEFMEDGRIPIGKLTVLAGDPGLGKSQYTCLIAAKMSRSARVLMLNAEDDESDTLRPRMAAAGANLENVGFVKMRDEHGDDGLVLPDDGAQLRAKVEQTGATLVVVDPIMAHLGGRVDGYRDQDVRRALAPLHNMGSDLGVTVIVVAHLKKGAEQMALNKIGGSIGFGASARNVLAFARDPDDPDGDQGDRRILGHIKGNNGRLQDAQLYQIETAWDGFVETSRLVYTGDSEQSVQDLLAPPQVKAPTKIELAKEFLSKALAQGPRSTLEVTSEAEAQGISDRTLTRARGDMGVRSERGEDARFYLSLPTSANRTPANLPGESVVGTGGRQDTLSLSEFGSSEPNPETSAMSAMSANSADPQGVAEVPGQGRPIPTAGPEGASS
ncbi:MAG: hypothetical protein JWO74_2292 [Solirubrobacterales bacterium]|nr:hypothetical protein [Solirubrobacterales bacterium]